MFDTDVNGVNISGDFLLIPCRPTDDGGSKSTTKQAFLLLSVLLSSSTIPILKRESPNKRGSQRDFGKGKLTKQGRTKKLKHLKIPKIPLCSGGNLKNKKQHKIWTKLTILLVKKNGGFFAFAVDKHKDCGICEVWRNLLKYKIIVKGGDSDG